MIVAELMCRDIVTVQPESSIAEAAQSMLRHRVSGLPVIDKSGHLVGILTEGDLLRRPELGTEGRRAAWMKALINPASLAAEYVHTHSRHVSDVMSRNPVFVRPETSLAKAAELMQHKRVKRLPVLQGETLVGVISRFDLLTALAPKLIPATEEVGEQEIQETILAALARELWAPKSGLRVQVTGTAVYLEGMVYSEDERRAARVLAENTRGVNMVVDRLELTDSRFKLAPSAK